MDLRQTPLHIKSSGSTMSHRLFVNNTDVQHFKCGRCGRMMPDSSFFPVDRNIVRGVIYLHPHCTKCRQQAKSKYAKHQLYTPALHRKVEQVCRGARSGAHARNIVWGLTVEDVLGMYISQDGKCTLSGRQMTYHKSASPGKDREALSIDRINSERNYTLDNVHLVCACVNIMKMDMSTDEFVTWCARVTAKVVYGDRL